jgi:hypothetical protein
MVYRIVVLLTVIPMATTALAQTLALGSVGSADAGPGYAFGYELDSARVLWSAAPAAGPIAATADGRHVAWISGRTDDLTEITLRDHVSGQLQRLSVSGVVREIKPWPRHSALSMAAAGTLTVLDSTSGVQTASPCAYITSHEYSLDGRRLFVGCAPGALFGQTEMVVLDAETLNVQRRLPNITDPVHVNVDGTRVTTVRVDALTTYDVASGQVVRTGVSPIAEYPSMRLVGSTARRNGLVITAAAGGLKPLLRPQLTFVVDADTLTLRQTLPVWDVVEAAPTPDGRFLVCRSIHILPFGESLSIVQLGTGVITASASLTGAHGVSVTAAPLAPETVTDSSIDGLVHLSWTQPVESPIATSYLIAAGSRPGLADIGTFRVDSAELAVPGVPHGTYFVRIRAVNAIGTSGPSPETVVVVPSATARRVSFPR